MDVGDSYPELGCRTGPHLLLKGSSCEGLARGAGGTETVGPRLTEGWGPRGWAVSEVGAGVHVLMGFRPCAAHVALCSRAQEARGGVAASRCCLPDLADAAVASGASSHDAFEVGRGQGSWWKLSICVFLLVAGKRPRRPWALVGALSGPPRSTPCRLAVITLGAHGGLIPAGCSGSPGRAEQSRGVHGAPWIAAVLGATAVGGRRVGRVLGLREEGREAPEGWGP